MIKLLNKMDKPLLILSIFMFVFGLFMIFDASSMISFLAYGSNSKYFVKQLIILISSLIVSIFLFKINTKDYKKWINLIALITVGLLMGVLMFGTEVNGAKSWLFIGSFGFQPSELAKLVIIIFMACYYEMKLKYLDGIIPALFPPAIGAIFTLLTMAQPDGGTGMILFFIVVLMFFASPVSKKIKVPLFSAAVAVAFVGIILLFFVGPKVLGLNAMQSDRFNFKKPCTRYQEATGYQVCNGYIAINNGKLFSIEPGNSKQKYLYLPEAYTDFIFPIIVEEMGLLTGIALILVYIAIIVRILIVGSRSPSIANSLICYGIAAYIFLHVVINLVGVLGLLPLTGVPLPFLSYGGSFAMTLVFALTIVQKISVENYEYMKKRVLS